MKLTSVSCHGGSQDFADEGEWIRYATLPFFFFPFFPFSWPRRLWSSHAKPVMFLPPTHFYCSSLPIYIHRFVMQYPSYTVFQVPLRSRTNTNPRPLYSCSSIIRQQSRQAKDFFTMENYADELVSGLFVDCSFYLTLQIGIMVLHLKRPDDGSVTPSTAQVKMLHGPHTLNHRA